MVHERHRRFDAKRRAEEPWRGWYKLARWRKIREHQLTEHPLCAWHLRKQQYVRATIVHHLEPHKGDPVKFWAGPFESLCKACHDGEAQSAEKTGYSRAVGDDGWPTDARHPFNRTR